MIDLHLRAETEQAALAALAATPLVHDGDWRPAGEGWALAVLGPVVVTPGTWDGDGRPLTPPRLDPRFHLNLRLAWDGHPLAAVVQASGLAIAVAAPRVVWA